MSISVQKLFVFQGGHNMYIFNTVFICLSISKQYLVKIRSVRLLISRCFLRQQAQPNWLKSSLISRHGQHWHKMDEISRLETRKSRLLKTLFWILLYKLIYWRFFLLSHLPKPLTRTSHSLVWSIFYPTTPPWREHLILSFQIFFFSPPP